MFQKKFILSALFGLLITAGVQAQTVSSDSTKLPEVFVPRINYSFSAGASFSSFGSATFVEPSVRYHVTPRFSVFSSLTMVQHWGNATFRGPVTEGGAAPTLLANSNANRQFLLHVGGSYAMTERLLLSGSVWKDLNPMVTSRMYGNPYTYGRLPKEGFQFNAQYKVSDNVTISGGVRYSNGGSYWNTPGAFNSGFSGYSGAGMYGPGGF
ncbi:hypothetical protein [Rufibacter sp. LB8]|uniref:hypothetical protein n=1 Tax=Rufibacter sp. LB8 TaxID=2777781 RepID=UPI00178C4774|nr:hypothetical protein [Rufibacter sp. LB8]